MELGIWILMIISIVVTFIRRKRLLTSSGCVRADIPKGLISEVELHERDGYKLISIENETVKLVKTKRHLYPWVILLPVSTGLITMFNTSFLCNIYGVKLMLDGDKIDISTY